MHKKIVMVCNTSWGMVKFRQGLISKLLSDGFHLTILAPKDSLSRELETMGCEFVPIQMDNKGTSLGRDLKMMRELYRHYCRIAPNLIIHYTIKPNIYGTIAAKMAGIPSIAVITGLGYTFINHNIASYAAKRLYRLSLRFADRVCFINEDDKNTFLRENLVAKEKIEMLPGEGVNTEKFAPVAVKREDNRFVFVLIARLLWDKGVGEYVEAARVLKKRYQNVEFDLVGFLDAKNPQAIDEAEVENWVEEGIVNYRGPVQDVRPVIAASDCVVLPSYREGISMVLMESASMQKPIIATNVPGCRDIVSHTETGFLVPLKDAKALARAMEKILHMSDAERIEMGHCAREHILREFDEKIVIRRYKMMISSLLLDEGAQFRLKKKR